MIFEQFQLSSSLNRHIESILYFKGLNPDHAIERVVPTGHIYIVFELDNLPRNIFDNITLKPIHTFTKVWISGAHRNFLSISAHPNSEMLVIQFKPTGAYPFLHCPIRDLNDKVIPGNEILGDEIFAWRENLLLADTPTAKFNITAKWLTERFEGKKEAPAYFLTLMEQLQNAPYANLKSIVDTYPASQKQLIEHFKKYVGLTPKYYHRILRFNEILKAIHQKEKVSWTNIAYSCDYADQSHFIKEFFLFSGFNPQEFIKQDFNKEHTNFFPIKAKG